MWLIEDRRPAYGPHQPIGHDDPLELGNPSAFGPELEGLDVDERFLDGNHQELSSDDLGTPLVPEGDLAGDEDGWQLSLCLT